MAIWNHYLSMDIIELIANNSVQLNEEIFLNFNSILKSENNRQNSAKIKYFKFKTPCLGSFTSDIG